MNNNTIEKKIESVVNIIFTYLEMSVATIVTLLFISYGTDVLQEQKENNYLALGYMIIVSGYLSFYLYFVLIVVPTKKILKHNRPKKSIVHLVATFLATYVIAIGILDLQKEHYIEDKYVYFGSSLILIGIVGVLFSQWRYKIIKRKEDLE